MAKWIVIDCYSDIRLENLMPDEYLLEKGLSKENINDLICTPSERSWQSNYLKEKKEGMIIYILNGDYSTPLYSLRRKNILTAFSSDSIKSFETYTPDRHKMWMAIRSNTKNLFELFFREFMPNIRDSHQDDNWKVVDITTDEVCEECSDIVIKGNLIKHHHERKGNYFICEQCCLKKQSQKNKNTNPGYIYFLKELQTGLVKIGKSIDVKKRVQSLQIGLPFDTKVILKFHSNDYDKSETLCHDFFKAKKVRGEWYKLSDEDIEWIKSNYNLWVVPPFADVQ